jgi:hypothetical protein
MDAVRVKPARTEVGMKARSGDWLVVEAVHVGEHRRTGQVIDVRGTDGDPPYVVRWSDTGRESVFFPREGTHVVPPEKVAE